MLEIADRLLARIDAGERVAVATAVSVSGSAPRTVGTSMAVTEDGGVIGSISGGCVEGAVYEACARVLRTGEPELARYGFDDAAAFAVGLSCGGRIEVLVTILTADAPAVTALRTAVSGHPAAVTSVLASHRLGEVVQDATGCEDLRTFTETSIPPARFLIFGAVEFSVALCNAAAVLGYRVTVCDARSAFATPARFPAAEKVVVRWPPDYLEQTEVDERTVVCILGHDDRFDVDLIAAALSLPVGYVGAMGSRATHARRLAELERRDIRDLDRLHAPIGLDLGASTPEETAISILAEVLAARAGKSGAPLTSTAESIHGTR